MALILWDATADLFAWVLLPPIDTTMSLCQRWLGAMTLGLGITVCLVLILIAKVLLHRKD